MIYPEIAKSSVLALVTNSACFSLPSSAPPWLAYLGYDVL
jgi:hypothetical protein